MSFYDYFRQAKTANERRQYYKEPQLVRAKRKPGKLWFVWDDLNRCMQRSWKAQSKKRRQHGYAQKQLGEIKRNTAAL